MIAVSDGKWIEAVVAVVVVKPGEKLGQETLLACSREHLAAYKVPKQIHFVDALPKNASEKLLKRELRATFDRINK